MDLIIDSSILINFFFGNSSIKKKISKVLDQYEKKAITSIIKYEMRNIFQDFIRLKQIIIDKKELLQKNKIEYFELNSEIIEDYSRKYHRQPHRLGRIRLLHGKFLSEFLKYNLEKTFLYLEDHKKDAPNFSKIVLNRVNLLLSNLEINLCYISQEIQNFPMIIDFDCVISDWSYYYSPDNGKFILSNTKTCLENKCDFKSKIGEFYTSNNSLIRRIIEHDLEMGSEIGQISVDEKMLKKLQIIHDKYGLNKNVKIDLRFCKSLGDFFIATSINSNRLIFTLNKNHFLPLLVIFGYPDHLVVLD